MIEAMKVIETNKFCDTLFSIKTCFPLNEETITILNLWVLMMRKKTKAFPTRQALTQQLSKTYGLQAGVHISGYGSMVVVDFRFRAIDFFWIEEKNYVEDVLTLMKEIVLNPILDEEGLQTAKYTLKNRLLRQHDDPESYVVNEAMKMIDIDHTMRILLQGDMEQMESITLQQVQQMYQTFLDCPKHVYVVGHCPQPIAEFFKQLPTKPFDGTRWQMLETNQQFEQTQQRQISQSAIAQIYQTHCLIGQDEFPALMVANSILGQSPSSLLFTNIREKHSYCYSISSSLMRFDGSLLITTGTQKENIEPLLELIQEQIETIRNGEFSDTLLTIAKKDILDGFMVIEDNPLMLIEKAFLDDLLERDQTIEERQQQILNVSKEDVMKAAQKWKRVSQMVLEGCLDA